VVCLHGGPGAGASLACVAKPLAERFATLDYVQRRSGDVPLTVAQHVEDLRAIIEAHCDDQPPVVLGASWGAMLALAFGAAHPGLTAGVVLVGCGTFDKASRALIGPERERRIRPEHRAEIARIEQEIPDPIQRIGAIHELTWYVDSYDPLPPTPPEDPGSGEAKPLGFDAPGFEQAWGDMTRLQEDGTYPAAFRAISAPVLMIHGKHDPHPGPQIRDSLLPHIPHLEYRELDRCGHDPWCERQARKPFFHVVNAWLAGVIRGLPDRVNERRA
jgi:pimeloyl-ACP methyl ester carboxylesterase